MRRLAFVTCVLVAAARLVAAQAPMPVLTFDEAVTRAIERNPTVARAAQSILQAEAVIDQARAVTRPSIDATLGNTIIDERVAFDDATIVPRSQFTFAANASMPVLAPARWARVAQARDLAEVATASVAEVRQQIAVATAEAFIAVVAARRQVEVNERALETAQAHVDYARRRLEGGVGSRLNMLRAAEEVSSTEARVEATRLALRHAQEALGTLLVENGPVDAAGPPTLEVPGPIDEATWMAARPEIVTQAAVIRAAERVVSDSWKDVAPEGILSFDPQYITPAGLFQPSGTWRLSFTVTQPIFQGGLQRAVKRGREVRLDTERIALTELENQARSDVRVAQASVESFERTLGHARQSVIEANEVLTITATVFEVGATTNIELIDAQRSARDRETTVTIVETALQRARLQLLVALGRFPR